MPNPLDTTLLTESVAIVERMVNDRLKLVAAGPTPELSAIGEYIDTLARLTAIRKSLFLHAGPIPPPATPQPVRPSPLKLRSSNLSDRPTPSDRNSSPSFLSSRHPLNQVRQIHAVPVIPPMPLDQIAPALDSIVDKLETSPDFQLPATLLPQPISDHSDNSHNSHSSHSSPIAANRPKFPKKRKRR